MNKQTVRQRHSKLKYDHTLLKGNLNEPTLIAEPEKPQEHGSNPPIVTPSGNATRLLLVTPITRDYRLLLSMMSDSATTEYNVSWAKTMARGFEKLRASSYDLCLINDTLDMGDGLVFISKMRRENLLVPTIMLINDREHERGDAAIKHGANDVLFMPNLRADLLVQTIQHTIERHNRPIESHQHPEQDQQQSESDATLYQSVLDSLYDVVFQTSAIKLAYLNAAWQRVTGYAPEDGIGRNIVDYVHIDDRKTAATVCHDLLTGKKESSSCNLRLRCADGKQRWITMKAQPLRDQFGQIVGLTGTLNEMETAQKVRADQSHLLDELANAMQAKDEFMATMSHELRTPLNAILGKSEVLLEGIHGSLTQPQYESVEIIQQSGNHLLELINDVLDLAKIEAGTLELEQNVIDINELIRVSLQQVQEMARKKKITLYQAVSAELDFIAADERRLRQILINLLSNAVKFTPEGGTVGLEAKLTEGGDQIRFHVRDTGIGISDEDVERLFQRFVQVDSSLARKNGGTGLGLALARHLAEVQGGSITVTSKINEGSTFTIAMPYKKMAEPIAKPPSVYIDNDEGIESTQEMLAKQLAVQDKAKNPAVPHILLAEDNEMNIAMMCDYLSVKGFHLSVARDGEEAVRMTNMLRPDLVLMDMQMPLLDGLGATRKIRLQAENSEIPIVGLTALAMPGDRERCLEAGTNAYMSKPIRLKELVALIQELLEIEE